jgi:hypothetical protein
VFLYAYTMKNTSLSPLFVILIASTIIASCSDTGSDTISTDSVTPTVNIPVTSNTTTETQTTSPSPPQTVSNNSTSPKTTAYSKSLSYRTNHGKHIATATFDITTKNDGTITLVNAMMNRGNHESAEYIVRFNNAASKKIIGQKISSLSLSIVGGASDTTDAFLAVVDSL